MSTEKGNRKHSPEFRVGIVRRMLEGANVKALSREHSLARSMMYRWRAAFLKSGPAGLERAPGVARTAPARPPGSARATRPTEEKLRQQIAELERKIGQQALQLDFFRGVFKRLKQPPTSLANGGKASTPRSGA